MENFNKENLEKLYIKENKTIKELSIIFQIKERRMGRILSKYNLKKSKKYKNIEIGDQFCNWTVINNTNKKNIFICKCTCENIKEMSSHQLRSQKGKYCRKCMGKSISEKNTKDLTGLKFGKLTVLNKVGSSKNRKTLWLCLCDCGNYRETEGSVLTCGMLKSCAKCGYFGEIINALIQKIKWKSKGRKINFNITSQYCWELFLKQNRKCALSGIELTLPTKADKINEGSASLDRINPSLGYEEGNVQWVHKTINRSKSTFTDEEFISLCHDVANNHKDYDLEWYKKPYFKTSKGY
jgi:hypothetical protein